MCHLLLFIKFHHGKLVHSYAILWVLFYFSVNEELAMAEDTEEVILNYYSQWQKPRRSGKKENKYKNSRHSRESHISGNKLKLVLSAQLCRFKNN